MALCAGSVYPAGCFGAVEKLGPLGIPQRMGEMGSLAALAGANGRLGDYGHGRGGGYRVDRSAGLTFAALRVMGEPC
mgnify:FL=1